MKKTWMTILIFSVILIGGCAKQVLVPYSQVEKNNWVVIKSGSGEKIEGTVLRAEPHMITIREKSGSTRRVTASEIQEIKRLPPFYDDFGNAISEEEIDRVQTNKNATIYGIGGGLLSASASFFAGSLLAHNADNGGTILVAATAAGGLLGTTLFVQAGKRQDRREAAENIRKSRKSQQVQPAGRKQSLDEIRKEVSDEKKKQEELRKQREQLLRELEKSRKNNN